MDPTLSAASGGSQTPQWLNVLSGVTQAAGNVATLFNREKPVATQVVVKQVAEEKAVEKMADPSAGKRKLLIIGGAVLGLLVVVFVFLRKN